MVRFVKIQDYLAAKFPRLVCGVEFRQRGSGGEYIWLENRPKWTGEVPGFPARFVLYPPDLSREALLEWAEAIELLLDSSGWSWLVPEVDCLAALRSVSQYVARRSRGEAPSLDGLEPYEAVLAFCRWLREAGKLAPDSSGGLKTIYYLGGATYQVEGHDPVEVTPAQDAILQVFLEHGNEALSLPKLCKAAGYGERTILRALEKLLKSYKGVFGSAIKRPGKPRQGGYRAKVVDQSVS